MKKKFIVLIVIGGILISTIGYFFISCVMLSFAPRTRNKTKDYQYMYNVVSQWNLISTYKKDNLFGYGEYLYNSYLLLMPRETPATLQEFSYKWEPGIDVDEFAIYFTCKLSEDNYNGFVDGLDSFEVSFNEETRKLQKNTEDFDYPAYIIQWLNPHEKWEVLEYILLDEQNNIVIYVYTMGALEYCERHSSYEIKPNNNVGIEKNISNGLYEGFTIYDVEGSNNMQYDLSFLNYLN